MNKKTILLELDKELCSGCGTCALVCPNKAITMSFCELGNLYPQINPNLCTGCDLCEKNCVSLRSDRKTRSEPLRAYAATIMDKEILLKSASGGVSAALCRRFVEAGGKVVGCSLESQNGTLLAKHICVDTLTDLWKFQGSKYVQSALGDIFKCIKTYLTDANRVLFIGTPCQVDALRYYLRNVNTDGLFTIDIVCHGVPSSKLFNDYLDTLKGEVQSFSFRDKVFGWGLTASYDYRKRNGALHKRIISPGSSSYYTYFLRGEIYRESCYICKYANTSRVGDLTIGDFWGVEKEHPEYLLSNGGELSEKDGISAILVNTEKGQRLLEEYGDMLILEESSVQSAAKWNRQLTCPSKYSEARNRLIDAYSMRGYAGVSELFKEELGCKLPLRMLKDAVCQILIFKK